MRTTWAPPLVLCLFACTALLHADDTIQRMRKAVEQCTLDQSGTHPFHLKAVLAPSQERDKDSGRTGEVEIWWKAPDQWRRELRSPDFHRIEIVSGGHQWQKNEGDYFPEWLRETAEELVRPVVLSNDVLAEMNGGDEKRLMGGTYLSWTILSTNGQTQSGMGAGIAIRDDSGLLYTANGFGFSGWFKDYSKFHNRMVARAVSVGSPEVTARVVTLEDLGTVQGGWFDAGQPGGDAQPVDTVLMEEFVARGHLAGDERFRWPAVKDGPLEGALTAEVTIDREGKVREIGPVVSTNPGMSDAGRDQIAALRFSPFTKAGTPVQVHSRITVAFKTTRPEGAEAFFSAQSYFEKARRQDYPSGGAGFPYVLKALFQARSSAGATDTGHYEDTWLEPGMWRREATFGASHVVRSRIGSKLYEVEEGPDVQLLLQIFKLTEPIPVADSLVESDWRIKSDIVDDARTIRVVSGYESADGKLDPEQARGYWFDTNGNLVKMYFPGMGVRLSNFADFQHVHVAQQIDVFHDSDPAMHIHITGVIPANDMLPKTVFEMKGHEVSKLYDSEAR